MGNGDSASRVLLQRCGPDYRLTTFRGSSEAITTDPRERTDGDMNGLDLQRRYGAAHPQDLCG